jgi:hypothetical protein
MSQNLRLLFIISIIPKSTPVCIIYAVFVRFCPKVEDENLSEKFPAEMEFLKIGSRLVLFKP